MMVKLAVLAVVVLIMVAAVDGQYEDSNDGTLGIYRNVTVTLQTN